MPLRLPQDPKHLRSGWVLDPYLRASAHHYKVFTCIMCASALSLHLSVDQILFWLKTCSQSPSTKDLSSPNCWLSKALMVPVDPLVQGSANLNKVWKENILGFLGQRMSVFNGPSLPSSHRSSTEKGMAVLQCKCGQMWSYFWCIDPHMLIHCMDHPCCSTVFMRNPRGEIMSRRSLSLSTSKVHLGSEERHRNQQSQGQLFLSETFQGETHYITNMTLVLRRKMSRMQQRLPHSLGLDLHWSCFNSHTKKIQDAFQSSLSHSWWIKNCQLSFQKKLSEACVV